MDALAKIRQAGFTLSVSDGKLLVAPAKNLTDQQRQFIKQHKAQIIAELQNVKNNPVISREDKTAILRWLTFIGENNQEIIEDVLDYCSKEPEALTYYLARSKEVDRATKSIKPGEVLA